jgi:hypothetical protein
MLIVPLPVTSRSTGTRFSKINLLFSVLPRRLALFLGLPSARLNPVS